MWLPAPQCFYSASKVTGNLKRSNFPILGWIQITRSGLRLVFFIGRQQDVPQLPHSCACLKLSQSLGFWAHLGETKGSAFRSWVPSPGTGLSGVCQPRSGRQGLGVLVIPSTVCLLLSQLLLLLRGTSEQASDTRDRWTSTIQEWQGFSEGMFALRPLMASPKVSTSTENFHWPETFYTSAVTLETKQFPLKKRYQADVNVL